MTTKKSKLSSVQPSVVTFLPARTFRFRYQHSLEGRFQEVLARIPFEKAFEPKDLIAVKMHFSNPGAHRTIRPQFVRRVVDRLKDAGVKPFVTDSVRMRGYDYLDQAWRAGYSPLTLNAPVIIADGLFGNDSVEVPADPPLGKIAIPSAIHDAPGMVVLSHVKGHIQSVYAGALKNLAMGCVSYHPRHGTWREGRGRMHFLSQALMVWNEDLCTQCLDCQMVCPVEAISFVNGRYTVDEPKCTRCGRCVRICPAGALSVPESPQTFLRAMAVSAKAVLSTFAPGKVWYVNFVLEVQPECDCMPMADTPVIQDQGILIGDDPVAVDAASYDLITAAPALPDSRGEGVQVSSGSDILSAIHAKEGRAILTESANLGLGTVKYQLKVIGERRLKE